MKSNLPLKEGDRKAVDEFRWRVSKLLRDGLIRLVLFGSKATGRDTPESDIDIFVLVREIILSTKDQIRGIAFDVNLKYGVYISPRIVSVSTYDDPVWRETPFLRGVRENGLAL